MEHLTKLGRCLRREMKQALKIIIDVYTQRRSESRIQAALLCAVGFYENQIAVLYMNKKAFRRANRIRKKFENTKYLIDKCYNKHQALRLHYIP